MFKKVKLCYKGRVENVPNNMSELVEINTR